MEEDLDVLEKALSNLEATEPQEKSDFEGLYKNWGKTGSQEERRAQLLEIQKVNRNSKIDRFRGILELVNAVEDNSKLFQPYKKVAYRPNIYVAGFHKTSLTYSNVLMLSEWMIEKPRDFAENWYVVPCPKGVRVLVVANKGTTKFYTKYGHFKLERSTALPGGNKYNFQHSRYCCVLDCFYYEPSNTLYLLDLLAWNNQPMTDGETEFRHYWMKTQLEDYPDTKTVNKINKVIIKVLPMMPCTTQNLNNMLSTYPQFENNVPPLDGLLFYHKRAHYVAGETPLVGWLFPYMIPEVLGDEIIMHPGYLAEKPADYVNQVDFIQKFEAKYNRKNKRRSSRSEGNMETDAARSVEQKDKKENKMESDTVENKKENKMDSDTVENKKENKMESDTVENKETGSMETDTTVGKTNEESLAKNNNGELKSENEKSDKTNGESSTDKNTSMEAEEESDATETKKT